MIRKKLLFLGGDSLTADVVETAKNMGVYTIVTDWYDTMKSPAKLIADESFMVSNQDLDSLIDLINQEGIDGVLTGFSDSTLLPMVQLCKNQGFPCYINENQVNITTDKNLFKSMCSKHQIPIVEEYKIEVPISEEDVQHIKYPVIVKPVDNSGARGIRICHDYQQLVDNYEYALKFSELKQVIVERYMTCSEATIFITAVEGEYYVVAIGDRHTRTLQKGHIPLPVGYIFPSHSIKGFEKIEANVKCMLKDMEVENGLIFIQSFVEDGFFIPYEMGYRLTGSLEYKITEELYGVNTAKMMIRFALTGKMVDNEMMEDIDLFNGKKAANLTFLGEPGIIGEIIGIDKINSNKNVVHCRTFFKEGQEIPESSAGTLLQVVARVLLIGDDFEQLFDTINYVVNSFGVLSDKGENILLDTFDVQNIEKLYEDN